MERVKNDVDAIISDEEFAEKLRAIPGSYFGFVVAVLSYTEKEPQRLENVLQFINDTHNPTTSDILKFISNQPDFFSDCYESGTDNSSDKIDEETILIESKYRICPSCMEKHEVQLVQYEEEEEYRGVPIRYVKRSYYCCRSNEYWWENEMISENFLSMNDAYRTKIGLLTSRQIRKFRIIMGKSQEELSAALGWEDNQIYMYENHMIQSKEDDKKMRKYIESQMYNKFNNNESETSHGSIE